MIIYSPIQKQQYKSKKLLLEQLDMIIATYETVNIALGSKDPNKYLVKVFSNEKNFEESYFLIKEHILKCFIQAPLGKDLRRNIAYFQILNSYKTIFKFSVQTSRYILKEYESKISFDWIKRFSIMITKKLQKLKEIIDTEDIDLINDILKNDTDLNILFEDAVQNIINTKTKSKAKTQDIREHEIDFLLITKNLERTGGKIKEIANQIYFISTGEEYFI